MQQLNLSPSEKILSLLSCPFHSCSYTNNYPIFNPPLSYPTVHFFLLPSETPNASTFIPHKLSMRWIEKPAEPDICGMKLPLNETRKIQMPQTSFQGPEYKINKNKNNNNIKQEK